MSGNSCVGWFQCLTVILTLVLSYITTFDGSIASSSSSDVAAAAAADDDAAGGAVAGGAVAGGADADAAAGAAACSSRRASSLALFSSYTLVSGQLSDQIHDRFAVLLHLGAALLDVALNSGPGADEDANVVAVVVVGLGNDTTRRARVAPLRRQIVQLFHPLWIKLPKQSVHVAWPRRY